jgi:hypothetical protein
MLISLQRQRYIYLQCQRYIHIIISLHTTSSLHIVISLHTTSTLHIVISLHTTSLSRLNSGGLIGTQCLSEH